MSKEIKAGMTSAEKMRALRERAQAAVDRPGQPFTELADSVLLEACRIAFARGRTFALDEIFKALMTRANKRADPENRVLIHFPRELVIDLVFIIQTFHGNKTHKHLSTAV
jgi:hypothetical protein